MKAIFLLVFRTHVFYYRNHTHPICLYVGFSSHNYNDSSTKFQWKSHQKHPKISDMFLMALGKL